MRLLYTAQFSRAYRDAPALIRRAFEKQSLLLLENPRHPSRRIKKYNTAEGKWQGRVNQDWRFYFRMVGDAYVMTDIIPHPK